MQALQSLGRYFFTVSWLSGSIIVLLPVALIAAGAPGQSPRFDRIVAGALSVDLQVLGALTILILVAGQMLHPLQRAVTQILEGYWGCSAPASRAMARSARRHLSRRFILDQRQVDLMEGIERKYARISSAIARHETVFADENESKAELEAAKSTVNGLVLASLDSHRASDALARGLGAYPEDVYDTMPTRLGNVLRRHERLAGSAYGFDAILATPLLVEVVAPELRGVHDDVRTNLDLSTRMVAAWGLATMSSLALLWPHGAWLVVPIMCFGLAWISYYGAVAAAGRYGLMLETLFAVGRFDLYGSQQLNLPEDTTSEYALNQELMKQLSGEFVDLRYRRPPQD